MSINEPPKSALSLSSLLSYHHSNSEPLDCSTPPVLDLSCRRSISQSPQPEGARFKFAPSPPLHIPLSPPCSSGAFTHSPEVDSSEEGSLKSDDVSLYPAQNSGKSSKTTRPFKAYPKDPFFLAIGASTADAMLGQESTEAYAEFRRRMLSQVRATNPPGVTNAKMRRSNFPSSTDDFKEGKDASYWEKRRKNNEAAKRSRDARRAKEDEIAIRAAFLEQENLKLKYEIATLRNEATKLRCLLYN